MVPRTLNRNLKEKVLNRLILIFDRQILEVWQVSDRHSVQRQ